MLDQKAIIRECIISALISAALSVFFFGLASGMKPTVTVAMFGSDFPIQSVMVALMASLVPGLILAGKFKVRKAGVLLVSAALAIVAGLLGVLALMATRHVPGDIAIGAALGWKAVYGGVVGVAATLLQITTLEKRLAR